MSQPADQAPDSSADQGASEAIVLVIEDDESIAHLLRLYLAGAGYRVLRASDGRTGVALHDAERPDLVILDLMLPGMDGWQVCRRIRAEHQTPILMLTARQTEEDRIAGLELGADDYVTKPFSPRELVSRVRAILRRAGPAPAPASSPESETLAYPGLCIVPAARRVEVEGGRVELTAKEFDLLVALARSPGRVFTREELLSRVWGYDYLGDSRTVDVHIGTLRKKIEPWPETRRYIRTVFRVGYVFEPPGVDDGRGEQAVAESDVSHEGD